jgi:protein O-mannosyl-transferase
LREAEVRPILWSMESRTRAHNLIAGLSLVALCWGAFGGALRCGFIYFDDDSYIFENSAIGTGWTMDGVRWAFTTGHAANWHPLTWLSHMTDIEWFGLDPKAHHAVSVWIHALNAVLLFGVLRKLTGRFWLSWWVAAFWCVHPLRVESVVWAAERKDVLAMAFGLLTLWVYADGRGLKSGWRQAAAAGCFALSLMSKPMWVTMPFALLLLDFWPLARWKRGALLPLWSEKWALFALAVASCVVTYLVQESGGAIGPLNALPLAARMVNAVVACAEYVRLLFWPSGLAVLYPYPEAGYSVMRVAASLGLGLALSAMAVTQWRRLPWLCMGWLWFLGTLVPMIGLVQVGRQSWADRYTYLPHIGLLIAVCGTATWGIQTLQKRFGISKNALAGLAIGASMLALAMLVGLSREQTGIWQTTESLFQHAISVTANNLLAHGNLGVYYGKQGQLEKAAFHLDAVLRQRPKDGGARYALGNVYLQQGRKENALREYRVAAQDPKQWEAMNNVAWFLATDPNGSAHAAEALEWADRAMQAAPPAKMADIWDTLSVVRANAGDFEGAIQAAERAMELAPADGEGLALRARMQVQLQAYKAGKAWRD